MKTKRRIISVLLSIVMIVTVISITAVAAEHYEKWICTGNGVHVRSGPSTYYDSYGLLYKDEEFWSRLLEGDFGSYRYGQCNETTRIAQAYGFEIWGYVSKAYLEYIGL
ncbi:MAG: hypothetical protein GX254_04685 [Clostridiales bacterium]|jgi:hypothetical protein|nr:hypothetical protein [Clostridiales bacterium]